MKKISIGVFSLSVLSGCLSSSENDAIKTLKNVYETKIGYTKGIKTSGNGEKIRYFGVKVAEGKYVNMLAPEIVAGNIAIYTYKNLDEADKAGKTHLTVSIKKEEKEINRMFPLKDMAAPAEQAIVFESFSLCLKDRRFEDAANLIDKKFYKPGNAEALRKYLEKYEAENGELMATKRLGFGLRTLNGQGFFEYNGIIIFKNGKCLPYTIHAFKDISNKMVANYSIDSALR